MDTIIGLGTAGCRIAEEFKKYPQYDVYKIDVGVVGEKCFSMKKYASPEEYEKNCPDLTNFFSDIEGEILFILAGNGKISGASLSILKQLKDHDINILYIVPSRNELSSAGLLQFKLTFNVLQQYARSGLFKNIYLISNDLLEENVGDVPILEFNKKLNEYLVSTIHYINIFINTDPVLDNYEPPSEVSRIATLGVHDISNNIDKYFYPIQNEKNKIYYFAFNEETLRTDGKLLRTIREHINNGEISCSYKIHSTKHEQNFCYFVSFSNVIQSLDN